MPGDTCGVQYRATIFGAGYLGGRSGWLLGFFSFKANIIQTESTQTGIRLMLSILPAIGAGLSVLFIVLYPLSETKLKAIIAELNTKRNKVV